MADVKNGNVEQSTDKEPITVVEQWTDLANNTTVVRNYSLELKADKFQPGDTVLVRAVAWDNRAFSNWGMELKSQEAATAWHAIKIIDEEAKTSASLEQIESLRGAVWKILEKQVRARIVSAGISKTERLAERTGKAGDLRSQQVDIQKTSAEVVNSIGQTDQEERQTIKRVLNGLAFGDMLAAVKARDDLANLKSETNSSRLPSN